MIEKEIPAGTDMTELPTIGTYEQNTELVEAFYKAMEESLHVLVIQKEPKWIPCSERLPNKAGEYLVCGKWSGEKSKTWICQFIMYGDIGGFANPAKNPPVSFWRPMPEPPEEI